MEALFVVIFSIFAVGGLIAGVMLTDIKTDEIGATTFCTMGIFKTVIYGDSEETRAFGIPVYRRAGCAKWVLGIAWKSADNGH